MGKDVVSFLSWAAEPEMEERKLMGFKWIFVLSLALLQAAYYRRLRWSILKSRKPVLNVVNCIPPISVTFLFPAGPELEIIALLLRKK
ncbi:hypothetical protein Pint_32932 [Pistacia integerrima]|uniref:Uncharacterized protein n=1 Tax=Pistacia integerrima TaxID=434235 RepID=A0ACC0X763_9ROSI|nr:hypothetical protein Pint_32932 [Pistacia integerrima]